MDSITYARQVADNVRDAIEQSGKSVLAIAEQTGIPRTTLLRRLDSPETSPLTAVEIGRLADATGRPIPQLVAIHENKKPSVPAEGDED